MKKTGSSLIFLIVFLTALCPARCDADKTTSFEGQTSGVSQALSTEKTSSLSQTLGSLQTSTAEKTSAANQTTTDVQTSSATNTHSEDQISGTLHIRNPIFRALKGAANGSAYLTITQTGLVSDKLIGATCEACDHVEIHDHINDPATNSKKMVEIKSIEIPSKNKGCWFLTCWFAMPKPVEFKKGGKHLMLMGIKPKASEEKEINIKLIFEKSGEVTVSFKPEVSDALKSETSGVTKQCCEHH